MQTLPPREILVVDDLDDPEVAAVVRTAGERFKLSIRRILNLDLPGACNSRNIGAASATSNIIAFLDDDDEWHSEFLACCACALAEAQVDMACSYVERCFPDGSRRLLTTREGLSGHNVLKYHVYITGSSFLIKADTFKRVGGFDPNVPVFNDWDFFIRLLKAGASYHVVKRPLAFWNEHTGDRITTGTLRRADGIDRFLRVYGREMSPNVFNYYLRLSTGIRRQYASGRVKDFLLTLGMLRRGGIGVLVWTLRRRLRSGTQFPIDR